MKAPGHNKALAPIVYVGKTQVIQRCWLFLTAASKFGEKKLPKSELEALEYPTSGGNKLNNMILQRLFKIPESPLVFSQIPFRRIENVPKV